MTTTLVESELLARAARVGLVTSREVGDRAVMLQTYEEGRRYAVVLHGRPIAWIQVPQKSSPAGRGEDPLVRQRQILRQLVGTDLAPLELVVDGVELWTLAGRGSAMGAVTTSTAELAEVCQAWGAATAALHRFGTGSLGAAPTAPLPWVLKPDRLPPAMRQVPAGSARALVLRTLDNDRALIRTVQRIADRWSARHWMHGNLTEDRVLVDRSSELRIRFTDFAVGGLGDPAWDLAAAVDTIERLAGDPDAVWGDTNAGCLVEFFLHGYRRAGGPGVLDPGMRALRTVTRAWDQATRLDTTTAQPPRMSSPAADLRRTPTLTQRLTLARQLATRSAQPGLLAA
ncbi:MAG: aminoglycoside phosphotransferase family protein [Microlunatus sp.]|nr:aminoglycoside phosphotransferase family protein [Microlunatus sp.]